MPECCIITLTKHLNRIIEHIYYFVFNRLSSILVIKRRKNSDSNIDRNIECFLQFYPHFIYIAYNYTYVKPKCSSECYEPK